MPFLAVDKSLFLHQKGLFFVIQLYIPTFKQEAVGRCIDH